MVVIPQALRDQFDGIALDDKTATAAVLATVDADGWPHLSFLSAGEVLIEHARLALTLWARAHSVAALERQRRGVLFAAADGAVHEVRFEVAAVSAGDGAKTAIVLARADALRTHKAPYAEVTGMIGFTLADAPAALTRWKDQIAAMRAALAMLPEVPVE